MLRRTIVWTLLLVAVSLSAQTNVPRLQREGEQHRLEAEAYYEQLHVVPPGMNWRVVNEAVRDARFARLNEGAQRIPTVAIEGAWREIGSINQSGRVVAVEYDDASGRVWLAGAGGTIWSGDTTGSAWKCHSDKRRIENPRLISFIRTTDGKERLTIISSAARSFNYDLSADKWEQATGLTEMQRYGWFTNAVYIDRGGRREIYAVGQEWDYSALWKARGVLYQSIDSGASFQRLRWIDGRVRIWTDSETAVWLIHGDTLSTVAPNGELRALNTKLPMVDDETRSVSMAGTDTTQIMFSVTNADSTRFFITSNSGSTWARRGAVAFGPFGGKSFARSRENGMWLFGGVNAVFSTDGLKWDNVNTWGEYYEDPANKLHADIPAIVSFRHKTSGITFIATDGGIYTTRTGGLSVKNISLRNLNVSQYYSSYTNRDNTDVIGVGSQDQGYQRSRVDSGGVRSFQQIISGDYSSLSSGDNGVSLFCVYPGFTLYIPDHEYGWELIGLEFPHKRHLWLPPLTVGISRPEQAWLGGGTRSGAGAYIYTYTRGQGKLEIDSLPKDFGEGSIDAKITALSFAPGDDDYCYVATSTASIWSTNNHGNSWQRFDRPDKLSGHYFSGNALSVDPSNVLRFVIGGSGYDGPAVYLTKNGGRVFEPLGGLPPCLVLGLAIDPSGRHIAAATDVGAFVFDTATWQWTDVTELGAPDQTYWHVDHVGPLNTFRFSTYGRGLWDFVLTAPVSVNENIIRHNDLSSARGVIVNGASNIEVRVCEQTGVSIKWYDLSGRLIQAEQTVLQSGMSRLSKPSPYPQQVGALTCVIVTNGGNVLAAVAP